MQAANPACTWHVSGQLRHAVFRQKGRHFNSIAKSRPFFSNTKYDIFYFLNNYNFISNQFFWRIFCII